MIPARRLSDVEAAFFYLHRECNGSTQVVTRVSMPGRWSVDTVRARLRHWAGSHPLLIAQVTERDATLWFDYDAPAGAPARVVTARDDFDPVAQLGIELNAPLAAPNALWRLSAHLQPHAMELYLTRNHVISDAYTTRLLVDSLIETVTGATPHRLRAEPLLTDRNDQPYLPPPAAAGNGDDIAVTLQPFMRQAPMHMRHTELLSRAVTPSQSAQLKAFCKANGLTVNQLFATLMMQAYAAVGQERRLNFYTAANTRGRYDHPLVARGLGCNIAVVKTPMVVEPDALLATARTYCESLRREDARWAPQRIEHAALLRNVKALAGASAFAGICLTNSGEVDPAAHLRPHASLVQTVVNRSVANYAMVLHLSSFGGAFHLNFTYAVPAMSSEFSRAVVEQLLKRLDQTTLQHRAAIRLPTFTN